MKSSRTAIRPPMSVRSPMPGCGSRIPWLSALAAAAGLVACGEGASEAPVACGVVPQQAVPVGEPALIEPCFEDPEGGTITLSASSSDEDVATVEVEGSTLRIEAVSPGLAAIAVVATDPDELTADIEFEVWVPNRPPQVCGQIPQQVLFVRQTLVTQACFEDPDGQELTLGASSSDEDVATVEVLESIVLRIAGVSPGSATVTIVATDPGGLSGEMNVQVLVPNRPPVTRGSPGPAEVVRGESRQWTLGDYIRDPDEQPLTYGTSSANPEVATASVVDGGTLMVTGVAEGTTMVTVTGTDPGGLSATIRFQVTITG